jgi:hypothetical protein
LEIGASDRIRTGDIQIHKRVRARKSMTKARSGEHPVEDRRKRDKEERREAELELA